MSNSVARRSKSALDEFLPELDALRDDRESFIEPGAIHLDPVEARSERGASHQQGVAADRSAQLWPMLAAALVGIGVAILAFAALAKFGQL